MRMKVIVLASLCAFVDLRVAHADPLNLFTRITYSGTDNSPPPADSLAVYESILDVSGLAYMPTEVAVRIPRENGDVVANVRLDHMNRREGFTERDPVGCNQDIPPPGACDIVPHPGLPANQFSYTWDGRGDGYDLRLTIHRGYAVGVVWGSAGRFEIKWNQLKELRMAYFRSDDGFDNRGGSSAQPTSAGTIPVLSATAAQTATLARIEPQRPAGAGDTALDILFLFTEEARRQAGGNPTDCRDTAGIMATIHQRIDDTNSAFADSQIPAQIGVATVSRLYGYTLIPHNGDNQNTIRNLNNITNNLNIKAYRNTVGADVVSVLFDTQTNLGPCGVANVQRHGCSYPTATPGCDVGAQFSEWATDLDTVECTAVQISTHELGHVLGGEHHYSGSIPRTIASFPYSYGYGFSSTTSGFETIMAQRFYSDPTHYPVRLLQFSNPNLNHNGVLTGDGTTADNAHTLRNLIPSTAAFRVRPDWIFASGFDEPIACPGLTY